MSKKNKIYVVIDRQGFAEIRRYVNGEIRGLWYNVGLERLKHISASLDERGYAKVQG